MKSLFLATIFLSASTAFASQNCNIFIERDEVNPQHEVSIGLQMRSVLFSKGFQIVSDQSEASYVLINWKQCQQGPVLGTYCKFNFNILSSNGSEVYSNTISTFDLEVLTANGKQRKALRKSPLICENGEIVK